jgi:hypothetical protein
MNVLHNLRPDYCVKICFHEIENQIDVFVVLGFYYAEEGDDIGMAVELLQEDHLCKRYCTSRYVR